jgi:hypothetical protein
MQKGLGLGYRIENKFFAYFDLNEIILFVWILRKAVGRSGLH